MDLREKLDFEGLARMIYPDQPQSEPKKFGALKQMLDISKELVRPDFFLFCVSNIYCVLNNNTFKLFLKVHIRE